MIWVLGVLCALALVALFFPFIFWVDFSADFSEITVRVRFFKKELYTYEKRFGKKELSDDEDGSFAEEEEVAAAPAPKVEKAEPPKPEKSSEPKPAEKPVEPESKPETEKNTDAEPQEEKSKPAEKNAGQIDEPKPAEKKEETKPAEKIETKEEPEAEKKKSSEEKGSEEKSSDDEKEEKRSLTDQEFWTLLLTPEFDTRAWWAVRHELSALFKLFRIRFVDCFVEGFRMEYETMGYAAALNGFLKGFPWIGDWDFRMDWTHDHELRAEGHVRASINVCRVLGLILATLFYGGIVAFTFWRRRAKILKTGELPELGFIRNKIVKMMSEDD